MKTTKKLLATAVATTLAFGAMTPVQANELTASATVASSYLWRGLDLGTAAIADPDAVNNSGGSGVPAVSGDLTYSVAGFYGGVWASSGDSNLGSEVDLFLGYGYSVGEFSVDVSYWAYLYPEGNGSSEDTFGDLEELVLTLGFGPFSVSAYENLDGLDYNYFTLGLGIDAYSLTLGGWTGDDAPAEYVHLDFGYAFNDNLSFTFSQVIDDDDSAVDDDLKVIVSYSLPIGE